MRISPSIGARRTSAAIAAAGLATVLLLTGCAGPGGGATAPEEPAEPEFTQADIDAALQEPAELTFWAWGPQYQAEVDAFNAKYPNVKVTLVNEGSGIDQYTSLQNVIKAGSGEPDIAQLEFAAMPQFALGQSLVNLNTYGLASMEDDFSSSSWGASQFNESLYGLPQDAGPMAMFYRQDVFDQFGLEVPTTWDDYIAQAEKLRAADPSRYMTADAGDPGAAMALIWQAGGRPFATEGESVSIDLEDEGTVKWADTWSQLIENDLVDTATPGFTPEWNAGLANGKYATLVTGAWAAGTLQRRIPEAAGNWRVAPLPQYEEGDGVTAQNGGSLSAVLESSENKLAAIGFVQWMAADPEAAQIWTSLGGFPCTSATLESDEWQGIEVPYFGNQKINEVFAESAEQVPDGWQFLPYQPYANSIFADSVGQAYIGETDLESGLVDWQDSLVSYGKTQGFTVE